MTTETGAPTLSEFLLARIAEDEASARAAERDTGGWENYDSSHWIDDGWRVVVGAAPLSEGHVASSSTTTDVAGHIARWDPARALAECEAKRWIIELGYSDPDGHNSEYRTGYNAAVATHMKILAAVYADHPGYRAEWQV